MAVVISMLRGVNVAATTRSRWTRCARSMNPSNCVIRRLMCKTGNVIFRTKKRTSFDWRGASRANRGGLRFSAPRHCADHSELRDVIARNPSQQREGIHPGKPAGHSSPLIPARKRANLF